MPCRVMTIACLLVSLASTPILSAAERSASGDSSPLAAWTLQLDRATRAGPWSGKTTLRSLERHRDRVDEHVEEWTWELDPAESSYARRLVVQARDVDQQEAGIAELLGAVVEGRLLEWTVLRGEKPEHVSAASLDGDRWRIERANPLLGRFLDGWTLADRDLRLDQLIQSEPDTAEVAQRPRRVRRDTGFECNRFTGENSRGEWQVDIADDGRLLEFRIEKLSRHRANGKPLAELSGYTSPSGRPDASIISMTVRVERSGLSTDSSDSGRWIETIVYSDGSESETEVLVERHRPEMGEQSLHARVLETLPDGTPVTINLQDPDPLPREYRDGQVVIRDDQATRSRITAAVAAATQQSAGDSRPHAWWAWMLPVIAIALVAIGWAWRRRTIGPVWLVLATPVAAASHSHAAAVRPLCGVESVFAAATMLGQDVAMSNLLDRRFVGSMEGSSEQELLDAVRAVGLVGRATRLVPADLDASLLPAILHVRGDPTSPEFNHWVCVVGVDGSRMLVINATRLERWSVGELAARWSGVALLVGRDSQPRLVAPRGRLAWIAVAIVTAIGVAMLVRMVTPKAVAALSGTPRVMIVILASAVAVGVGSDLVRGDGLLAQPVTRELLRRHHLARYIPSATIEMMKAYPGRVIVDARHVADYLAGHVQGAVSIPPDATDHQLQRAMLGVRPDAEIIIYCQSRGCPFARSLAARMDRAGYTRLFVFEPGWDALVVQDSGNATRNRRR